MFRFPGPLQRSGGRPAREAEIDRGGKGRWSAKRKTSVVLELLRSADLESTSRKYGVTAATLTEWRDAFLAAGAEALKVRQEAQLDEQGPRQKGVIAEITMENELLREHNLRLGLKFDLLRHAGTPPPRPVRGPLPRQVQPPGHRQADLPRGRQQCHRIWQLSCSPS
jgi:hypothetical protein